MMQQANGMIVVPIMTPYGTQMVPMTMAQLMSGGMVGGQNDALSNLQQLQQLTNFQQQAQAQQLLGGNNNNNNNNQNMRNMNNMQANLMQSQMRAMQNAQNPIASSILQQQAQILRNHQKTQSAAFAAVAAANQKAVAELTSDTSGKKNGLGAIGDFRPMNRSASRGQSSGFSSGNASESDSGSDKIYLMQHAGGINLKKSTSVTHSSTSHFSSNSSGWSESGSGDEMTQAAKNNIKLLEQRSGSKALFLQKMVEVLDGYFSDEGLKRNQFLAKQLQLNPEGIPLRKVAGMRRVKTLTRDLLTVATAVRKSPLLELSRDGCLVKRTVKPSILEPPKPIRTVLAINLEHSNPTVESVTSAFAKYGELTQVRVIRPTSCLPSYLKEFTMWVPDLGTSVCAIIEFETQEEAQAACREINMANRAEGKLRVALLKPGARIRRTLYRTYKDAEILEGLKQAKASAQTAALKIGKVQSDSGHGSDGSNEASTENSEDEIPVEITKVVTRRSWLSKAYQIPKAIETTVIRQPIGPEENSRGFASKFCSRRRQTNNTDFFST